MKPVIRIEEAIAMAKGQGMRIKKKDIAARLWPESSKAAQQVNMTKLCTGATLKVRPEWLIIISEMCGVSVNFLIGKDDE